MCVFGALCAFLEPFVNFWPIIATFSRSPWLEPLLPGEEANATYFSATSMRVVAVGRDMAFGPHDALPALVIKVHTLPSLSLSILNRKP